MEIRKSFEVAYPVPMVWDALSDLNLVAQCLPGASIVELRDDGSCRGRFSVKLGPLAAAFEGDVSIERKPDYTAVVSGKGADARSQSRVTGAMTYRLEPAGENRTRVDTVCEFNLAGALAQFGKGAVLQEVANRITAEFARNFEGRLAEAGLAAATARNGEQAADAAAAPASTAPLDAGKLVWAMLRDRWHRLLRSLYGRRASSKSS
jgi:carbon monoxide dehydrogenase subunit G